MTEKRARKTTDRPAAGKPGKGRRTVGDPASSGENERKLLQVEGLRKVYKKKVVVDEVSLNIRQGEIVGLLGPNGAGKTTSFYMIVGLVKPDGGRILLDEHDITRMPMYKRAKLGIGYLPQEASVFRKLTVEENLMAILETLDISREERIRRKDELLDYLNISHLARQKAYTLSGGERRRTEIARSLTTQPRFLLLDEPFAGVDPIAVADIQKIVVRLRDRNLGVIITDHNVRETLSITDRAYILAEGRILVGGRTDKLINNSRVRKVYLGKDFQM